ncbi:MAG TPA: prepilin peptidase [Bryobacteraceae bacterium]|jgi:leader peptidase (prepilin peptidase)/N-methyltransferase
METAIAFLAGLLIGSFLNVCIYRLPKDLSVVAPRSYCPQCERTISWYDNIPLLSYLLLKGGCRFCRARIPARYPAVELSTGIAFAICVGELGLSLAALKWCVFSAILIALIATDFEERILPDEFTLGGTVLGLVLAPFVPLSFETIGIFLPPLSPQATSLIEAAFGAAVAAGSIWLFVWIYQKIRRREDMMGFGDVKMIAMIGAFLGAPNTFLAIGAGSLVGGVLGLLYIVLTRKDFSTYPLPFGSFLGAGALAVAFVEEVFNYRLLSF